MPVPTSNLRPRHDHPPPSPSHRSNLIEQRTPTAPTPPPPPPRIDAPDTGGPNDTGLGETVSDLFDEFRSKLASLDLGRYVPPRNRDRIGGVAPTVEPPTVWRRLRDGRLLERRGFVPMSPARAKRRHRILPRTVIGISFMLLSFAVGAAFAGAGFYAYYDNRLAANEQEIARFVDGFDDQFVDASEALNQLRADSLDQIRDELQPLGEYVSEQNGVVNLPAMIGESVYQLRTANDRGVTVSGSAAAVAKHQGGTALVTSYSLVKSSTIAPGPGIELIKGDDTIAATLWSWDPDRDLALVVTDVELPRLSLATDDQLNQAFGARIFAMSGTGGQGATASPGTVLDRSSFGIQHTAAVGELFNGGPIVSSDGTLVGVASASYAPLGVRGGEVRFAPDLSGLCSRLLNCADPVEPEAVDEPGG
ncbi:MAG: trypsin-like peptidase domain-containing protein [Acidimicrobiales bacterium]|nr:trypsin-like peptidase domain-containing protein [Acidimicrobiales bacterium]